MKRIILWFLMYLSAPAFAGNLWCYGLVKNVYVDKAGSVVFNSSFRNDYLKACNLKSDDTVTCSIWASMLMSAVTHNLTIRVMYSDNGLACDALNTYGASPEPVYIMLNNEK